jgi:uncharacterized protein YacL
MLTVSNQGTVVMDFPYLTIQAATRKGMIIGLLVANHNVLPLSMISMRISLWGQALIMIMISCVLMMEVQMKGKEMLSQKWISLHQQQ